jgi:glutamyl-tRNA synthetase
LGEGTKKLSKRDPQSDLFLHRDRGFLPEGLLNYLALLGWGIAEDRDVFTLPEMVAAFDVVDVNSNPARFDQKKADAINAEHIRRLPAAEFARRLHTFFQAHGHDTGLDEAGFATAAELVQTRVVVLSDGWELLKFLDDVVYAIDPKSGAKELTAEAVPVLDSALGALDGAAEWTSPAIEETLKAALIDGLGLKPRKAFGPIRVAVTGATVSPPLYESMELLGRERTIRRLREARDGAARNLW